MVHGPINRVPFMGERETFKGWWFIALNLGRQRFSLGANMQSTKDESPKQRTWDEDGTHAHLIYKPTSHLTHFLSFLRICPPRLCCSAAFLYKPKFFLRFGAAFRSIPRASLSAVSSIINKDHPPDGASAWSQSPGFGWAGLFACMHVSGRFIEKPPHL